MCIDSGRLACARPAIPLGLEVRAFHSACSNCRTIENSDVRAVFWLRPRFRSLRAYCERTGQVTFCESDVATQQHHLISCRFVCFKFSVLESSHPHRVELGGSVFFLRCPHNCELFFLVLSLRVGVGIGWLRVAENWKQQLCYCTHSGLGTTS